jgi:uncharacterized protein YqeY
LSVIEQVRADATRAMKAGDRELVGALRMLLSELQNDAKEGRGDAVAVLRRERKRRLEAASQFRDGGRDDLADQEEREAGIIDGYLPAELDDARLSELVGEAIAEVGASGPGDLGQVMKLVMSRSGGQLDGKRASAAVREALSV